MTASGALGFLALTLVAIDAHAGVIHGRVKLPCPPTRGAGATAVVSGGAQEAVVWVDSLPPYLMGRFAATPREARVAQLRGAFVPRVTAVAAGSAVRFTNRDDVYHQVFSISEAKRFDLGKNPPRAVGLVTFDQPGIVNLFDEIHPEMAGYVVVLPHRLFARPTASGDFVLPDLPPGTYSIHAWHPACGDARSSVVVPRYGVATVALSF